MSGHIGFFLSILPDLLSGLRMTLYLSVRAIILGVLIGLPLAVAKVYGRGPVKAVANTYIEIIRCTPMVVQLFVIYFGLTDVGLVLDRIPAAILALGINSGAYQAEYFRGAIQSIDAGQMMAAEAIGMSRWQAVVNVILPQALRLVLPPWANEAAYMVKGSSIAFLIAVPELMARGKMIISWTFKPVETLFWVGVIYVVVLSLLAKLVDAVEIKVSLPGLRLSRGAQEVRY